MNISDVKEWMIIADDDFDSAKILNESFRKHMEVICYLCAQATEKYLKCYLTYNGIIPQKTHNLVLLNDKCIEIDDNFQEVKMECGFLNRYINEIRYPYRVQVYEEDVMYVIRSVEKIRSIEALKKIREELM
ncbi:MAG: HEPN domain-containing protein [Treponema sp.]|jgi:HEPN domain-containing protein|nr:HEPN domain-containing protein [Treponema sp.]